MSTTPPVSLTTLRAATIAATFSSSYFFFGNLGAANVGVVPAVRDAAIKNSYTAVDRARLWKWFYDRAKFQFAGSSLLSSVSLAVAAFVIPAHTPGRRIALVGSALSFVVVPYTVLVMLPVNNTLGDVATQTHHQDNQETTGKENQLTVSVVDSMLDRWRIMHIGRMTLGFGAWVSSILLLSAAA